MRGILVKIKIMDQVQELEVFYRKWYKNLLNNLHNLMHLILKHPYLIHSYQI